MEVKNVGMDVFFRQIAGFKKIEVKPGVICGMNMHYNMNRWSKLTPSESAHPGVFGYMLMAYKDHAEGFLDVLTDDGGNWVVKFPGHIVYAKTENDTLGMSRGDSTMSGISESVVIAAIAAEELGLWSQNPSPEAFCDAVYFGYAKRLSQITDEEMEVSEYQSLVAMVENAVAAKSQPAPSAPQKAKSKKKKTTLEEWWEEVKNGKYRIEYDGWSDIAKSYIRPMSFLDDVIPTPELKRMILVGYFNVKRARDRLVANLPIDHDNYVNMQLMGDPGTGKTFICEACCAALGLPFNSAVMNKNQNTEVVEGSTHVIKGELDYKESVVGEAAENGVSVLLDEFLQGDTNDNISAFNSIVYKPHIFYKDGYKKTERHPLSIMFCCFNLSQGCGNFFSPSLSSRFSVVVPCLTASDDLLKSLLEKMDDDLFDDCEYSKEQVTAYVYNAFKWANNSLGDNTDLKEYLTFRACEAMVREIASGVEPEECLADIYGQLYSIDRDVAEVMAKGILRVVPNIA